MTPTQIHAKVAKVLEASGYKPCTYLSIQQSDNVHPDGHYRHYLIDLQGPEYHLQISGHTGTVSELVDLLIEQIKDGETL